MANPYKFIYDFLKYSDSNEPYFNKHNKALIFDTEEINDDSFYKEWFKHLKKYIKIDTKIVGKCPICNNDRLSRTRIVDTDTTIYYLCMDCGNIINSEEMDTFDNRRKTK